MRFRLNSHYLLIGWFCWYVPVATAQANSIDPRTAMPSACIAPSEQTGGLEFTPDSSYLQLSNPSNEAYASIDGDRMKRLVEQQTDIAQRYRQAGNQFWGRIIGTSADSETAEWMMVQLRESGVENVRLDSIPLPTQWLPQSWQLTVELDGKATQLTSAWPA